MAKKTNRGDSFKKIIIIIVGIIGLALVASAVVLFSRQSNEILERSQTEATNNGLRAKEKIEEKVRHYTTYVSETAGSLEDRLSSAEVQETISSLRTSKYFQDGVKNARYFVGDKAYNETGYLDKVTEDLAFNYRKVEGNKVASYLGINVNAMVEREDESGQIQLYEFYSPVKNNPYCEGLSLYFDKSAVEVYIGEEFRNKDNSKLSVLAVDTGNIVIGTTAEVPDQDVTQALNTIGVFDVETINAVQSALSTRTSLARICKVGGIDHVISIQSSEFLKDLLVVEVYECSALAKNTTDLINAIIAIIVIFIVIIVTTVVILTLNHFRLQRKINNAEKHDLKLDCLNKFGFEKEAEEILHREAGNYYAVIVLELRHFKFLVENYGEGEVNSLLKYLKLTLTKTCRIEEIYGHMDNGQFLLLLHASNRADLIDRLKIHSFLASQYKGSHKFDVAIKYGIYEYTQGEQTTTNKMIDYALEANNTVTKATVENVDMQFNFYDDELRKIRLINDDMELRQETALRDGEFQVFYQAKYNLKNHKQDGAEALVRWYDKNTGEYNKPALFMPLFESNGFIEKLDKYVYTKVCEYISYSLQQGRNVFPVSVNVSRITATQPDFVDYYTRIKKKYGIANGALTIEFTESFAYENYDVLKTIVDRLHKAGFQTSIDDFGCGYSSYRILKELPMDEIKLDKFFIDYSENPERINSIFESVISLAKKLNMKVTQEGVERPEDVELLKKLGCDVIQGYIYSHPLSLTDYLHFVENTKDHNL